MPATYDGILRDEGGAVFNVKNPRYWDLPGSDDAARIQAAVEDAKTHGGIVYVPPGTYLCHSTIRLESGVTLAGAGSQTVLKRAASFRGTEQGFLIAVQRRPDHRPSASVVVRDLALDGAKDRSGMQQSDSGSSLLLITTAERCRVSNVSAYDGLYDGIILEYCKDSVIEGCSATGCLKVGIYLSGCNRIMLTNNHTAMNDFPGALIACSWYCTLTGNDFRRGTRGYGGLHLGRDTEYCTVSGNYCEGIGTELEPVIGATALQPAGVPGYITGERLDAPPYNWTGRYTPLRNERGESPDVATGVSGGYATYYALYNSVIANNVVSGHSDGIRLVHSNGNRITGNVVSRNGARGILLYGSSANVISANTVTENGSTSEPYSVLVAQLPAQSNPAHSSAVPSSDNIIEGNDIRSSTAAHGIYLDSGSYLTVIRNNRIAATTAIGGTGTSVRYGNYFPTSGTVDGGIRPS